MKTRFVKSVIATAKSSDVKMPWTRGASRAANLASRKTPAAASLKRA